MSELTRCNFCTLQAIAERYGKRNIRIVGEPTDEEWLHVERAVEFLDIGEPFKYEKIGIYFKTLTLVCVC